MRVRVATLLLLSTILLSGCSNSQANSQANSQVSVYDDPILPSDVIISQNSHTMEVSETKQLSYHLVPSNASTSINWSSSNRSIASVSSNGLVTANAVGQATITVTTSNGKFDACLITVNEPAPTYFEPGEYVINESEPNDSLATADNINVNGTTIYGSNSSKYDIDFFKIYLSSGTVLGVIFTSSYSVDLTYYLVGLLNAADTVVAAATKSASTDTKSFVYTAITSGYYYLVIIYSDDSPFSNGGSYLAYAFWM
jgi:hypothetical protein